MPDGLSKCQILIRFVYSHYRCDLYFLPLRSIGLCWLWMTWCGDALQSTKPVRLHYI